MNLFNQRLQHHIINLSNSGDWTKNVNIDELSFILWILKLSLTQFINLLNNTMDSENVTQPRTYWIIYARLNQIFYNKNKNLKLLTNHLLQIKKLFIFESYINTSNISRANNEAIDRIYFNLMYVLQHDYKLNIHDDLLFEPNFNYNISQLNTNYIKTFLKFALMIYFSFIPPVSFVFTTKKYALKTQLFDDMG